MLSRSLRGFSRLLGRTCKGILCSRPSDLPDMNAMQAELRAGRVDIAPMPTSLSPDAVNCSKRILIQVNAFPVERCAPDFNTSSAPPITRRQAIST